MSPINEREFADDLLYLNTEMNLPFKYDYKENTFVRNGELAMASASILGVDDDEAIVRLLENYLQMKGFSHVGASNAFEALEILNQKHIDLVISDIKLGGGKWNRINATGSPRISPAAIHYNDRLYVRLFL